MTNKQFFKTKIEEGEKACCRFECISCYHSSHNKEIVHENECNYKEDNELTFRCGDLIGMGGEDFVFYCNDCKHKISGYSLAINQSQQAVREALLKIKDEVGKLVIYSEMDGVEIPLRDTTEFNDIINKIAKEDLGIDLEENI
jgi:hypothetical protein